MMDNQTSIRKLQLFTCQSLRKLNESLSLQYDLLFCDAGCDIVYSGARKTREWKTRHQMTGVENAGVDNILLEGGGAGSV